MHYTYDANEYNGVSNFITSDTVLDLYHQFYEKSLISVEADYLYDDLDLLTSQMLNKSLLLYQQLSDDTLKELQKNNIVYFLVARMLMLKSTETGVQVDADVLELARQEYALVQSADGIKQSPFIKKDLDYSMFTVRGHYTRTEELGKFFQTMMWFGIFPYELCNGDGEVLYNNVLQSLLMTYMTFAVSEQVSDAKLWSNIYLPTSQYVGMSDDIDVFTMNNLRKEVFGDDEKPNNYNDPKYYDKLQEAVKNLPEPQIQGKVVTADIVTGKQFRYMGQRYVLDSDIMQDLVDPILRTLPSSLDVMGVSGQ